MLLGGAAIFALWWLSRGISPSLDVRFTEPFVEVDPTSDFPSGAYWGDTFLGPDRNVAAFLYMIRRAEHSAENVAAGDDYRTFYGGSMFSNLSDHPVITGEKSGVRLTAKQCRALGYSSGVCVSTAAGAYQFIRPTWTRLRELPPRLPDFSPDMQDLAAIRLLDQIGALTLIEIGDIEGAIAKAATMWASLPGSLAQQNPRSLDTVIGFFNEGGGNVA